MKFSKKPVIVDGVRTPFCKMGTSLARLDAAELGRTAVNALLARTGIDPGLIDETLIGCVSQPVHAANVARVIALRAGVPQDKPAVTVHRNCASGLESLTDAALRIEAGAGDVFLIGGTESMTQVPLLFSLSAAAKFAALSRAKQFGARLGAMAQFRPEDFAPIIGLKLGLTDPVSGLNMGETAELLAREYGISRDAQDEFALESHRKAAAGRERLAEEIVPAYVPSDKGKGYADFDNGVREDSSLEALGKLKPMFDRKTGTVTAGNSSQITDGAAMLLVMSEEKAEALGLEPLGRITSAQYTGCDPARMGLGPVSAISDLSEATGLKPADADVVEINEAFAAQVLAVLKELEARGLPVPVERLNPNGGAIALGHPVGATGSRLALTALKELKRTGGRRALVSLCVGGGQGAAVWLESV